MSDAAITAVIIGATNITAMLVGFLTLWVKLKYGVEKAEEASIKASAVEGKIDHNTMMTTQASKSAEKAVARADQVAQENANVVLKIEKQTNSLVDALKTELAIVHKRNDQLLDEVKRLTSK